MSLKKTRPKRIPWALALIPVAAVAAVLALTREKPEAPVPTENGIAYLEERERQDPDVVMKILRDRHRAELKAQREELLRQVKADEISPFTLFQDAVLMGDSRAEGYWYYGFVDQSRTLTGAGHTILDLNKQLDAVEEMNPQYIYLLYGLNDVKIGYWGNKDRFVEKYMEYIAQLRQRLPDSVVVVSSILPYHEEEEKAAEADGPTEPVDPEVERMKTIPQWNAALAAACKENNVIFVDNTAICEVYANLWEPDGIHIKQTFYKYWVKNLVIAALEEGSTQVEENNS